MTGDMKGRDSMDDALHQLYSAPVPASFLNSWQDAVIREESKVMNQEHTSKTSRFIKRVVLPVAAALVLVAGALSVDMQSPNVNLMSSPQASYKNATMYNASSGSYRTADSTSESAAAMDSGLATGGMTASGMGDSLVADDQRKLVRTASLTLRTASFDDDLAALNALIAHLGGYVENTYQSGDSQSGDARSVSMTVRVPSQQLDAFLTDAGGIGRVVGSSQRTTDMTVQYADNDARLKTLRDKITRLNALLLQAENVADIIEIESAISDTQYSIDSYETTQRTIDRQVDMSQVDLSLMEDSPVAITSEMSMGERLSAAFSASVAGLGRFLRNMLVFVVMALPVLVPVAVIIVLIMILKRRRAAKRRAQPDEAPRKEV